MRALRTIALAAFACLTGIAAGEVIYRSVACREMIGRLFGRGHLIALVQGNGIYQFDLRREIVADHFAAGSPEVNADQVRAREEAGNAANRLVVDAVLRISARKENVPPSEGAREGNLQRSQFASEWAFIYAMRANGFSKRSLWTTATDELKSRRWIEKRIAGQIAVTEEECREFYRTHRDSFAAPLRLRANHLFLAAPAEAPWEVVESKRIAIESFWQRIAQGENFLELVAESSEDEATKSRGGDLGFFASSRMPPEFFAAVVNLRVGEKSKPFRSHLGFHIVEITGIEPAREMPFEEARPEIIGILQNEQRSILTGKLAAEISQRAEYFTWTR